jgi:hypothetical protein
MEPDSSSTVFKAVCHRKLPQARSPDLICKPYFLNIHLNIILPAMTRTYNSLSSSGFLTKILQTFSSLPCELHGPYISSSLI